MSKRYIYHADGRRAGRTYANSQLIKALNLNVLHLVPSLRSMDTLISLGVQPSKIMMPSEFRNTSTPGCTASCWYKEGGL